MSYIQTVPYFKRAYAHFNAELFSDVLPCVEIVLEPDDELAAYYAPRAKVLAINPEIFAEFPHQQILATLVHEQVHVWQRTFGNPTKHIHNLEWTDRMNLLGIVGDCLRETSVIADGPFDVAFRKWQRNQRERQRQAQRELERSWRY